MTAESVHLHASIRRADLAGTITVQVTDQHADFFIRNLAVVRVEQDLRPYGRYGYWEQLPRDLMGWPSAIELIVERAYDALRPWTRPDRPWPILVLFPRVAAGEQLWANTRALVRRWRARAG